MATSLQRMKDQILSLYLCMVYVQIDSTVSILREHVHELVTCNMHTYGKFFCSIFADIIFLKKNKLCFLALENQFHLHQNGAQNSRHFHKRSTISLTITFYICFEYLHEMTDLIRIATVNCQGLSTLNKEGMYYIFTNQKIIVTYVCKTLILLKKRNHIFKLIGNINVYLTLIIQFQGALQSYLTTILN